MPTPNHITHLIRLDNLCKDWSSIHSCSCTYFSSLVNILAQRKETSNLLLGSNETFNSFNTNLIPSPSISFNKKHLPYALQSQSLTLLIYKQSREIEEIITKIHSIIQKFEEVINSMKVILNQSTKLVNPNQIIPSTNLSSPSQSNNSSSTSATTTPTKPSSSSKKKKSKQHPKTSKSSNPQKKHINLFDNLENPDDVADIPIITSNHYIVRIVEMYEKELCYKKNLIFGGCFKIDHNDNLNEDDKEESEVIGGLGGVKLIGERWAAQPYLLFEIEKEMCDRIKIWKRVKEYQSIK